jgi:uncharacterized protein
MRLTIPKIIIPAFLVFAALAFYFSPLRQQPCADFTQGLVKTRQVEFQVTLAETAQEQSRGLMHCQYLPDKNGMYFIYQEPTPVSFWMKNTPISLDIVWINRGRIIGVAENTTPNSTSPTYSPPREVTGVLELPAGSFQEYGLQVGDSAILHPSL